MQPAMRKAKKLPASNITFVMGLARSSVLGFGYDYLSDDYKIVQTFDSEIRDGLVSVYSLRNNSRTRAEAYRKNFCVLACR